MMLRIIHGKLKPRQLRLVSDWVDLRRAELEEAWSRAASGQPAGTIEPLP